MHSDKCPGFYNAIRPSAQVEPRLLSDPVQSHVDLVSLPAGEHFDAPMLAVYDEGCRPDTLERVSKLPAARAHVVRLIGGPDQEIERTLEGQQRQAGTVIPDGDRVRLDYNLDLRCPVGLLAGIERVVD